MIDEQPTVPLPSTHPSENHYGRSPQRLSAPLPHHQQYPDQPSHPDPAQMTPLYSPSPSMPLHKPTPSMPLHSPPPSAPLYLPPVPYPAYTTEPKPQTEQYLPQLWHQNRTSHQIMATIGCAALALVIIGALWFLGSHGHTGSSTAGSQQTRTSAATGTTSSTGAGSSRLGTQAIFAPVLGGTVNDFTLQFGTPEDPANNESGVWQQITVAGQSVTLLVSTAPPQDTQDGDPHVMSLTLETAPNVTWSSSTQQQIMAAFLPSDAKFVNQVSTASGNERVYISTQLAATFKASLFTNQSNSQTVAPGTFDEQCYLGGDSVQVGGAANSCSITLGIVN
jgi:hypothetical protein